MSYLRKVISMKQKMNKEKWQAYQEKVAASMEKMRRHPFSVEQAIEQQRRMDEAAGRKNPYLGMSFDEVRKARLGLKTSNQ